MAKYWQVAILLLLAQTSFSANGSDLLKLETFQDEFESFLLDRKIEIDPDTKSRFKGFRVVSNRTELPESDLNNGKITGLCVHSLGSDKEISSEIIILHPSLWSKKPRNLDDSLRALVFHELVHCLLNRGHSRGSDRDLMNADFDVTQSVSKPILYRKLKSVLRTSRFSQLPILGNFDL